MLVQCIVSPFLQLSAPERDLRMDHREVSWSEIRRSVPLDSADGSDSGQEDDGDNQSFGERLQAAKDYDDEMLDGEKYFQRDGYLLVIWIAER